MSRTFRISQIVPSSNITMETEIPAMLVARQLIRSERFTLHSSHMRMKHVNKVELAAMDAESERCALGLSDAQVGVLDYACLVTIMSMRLGYHRESQTRLAGVTRENNAPTPLISSARALVKGNPGKAVLLQRLACNVTDCFSNWRRSWPNSRVSTKYPAISLLSIDATLFPPHFLINTKN